MTSDIAPNLICYIAGALTCAIVYWSLPGKRRLLKFRSNKAPTLFGNGVAWGHVHFALEQYERLVALEEQPASASTDALTMLAGEGHPDLALWLMLGIALERENPRRLGDCLVQTVLQSEDPSSFAGTSLAGAALADLCDRPDVWQAYVSRSLPRKSS